MSAPFSLEAASLEVEVEGHVPVSSERASFLSVGVNSEVPVHLTSSNKQ